jgi:hypothetical protein
MSKQFLHCANVITGFEHMGWSRAMRDKLLNGGMCGIERA